MPDKIGGRPLKGPGRNESRATARDRHGPATRRVLPVVERADARDATLKLFNLLMGKVKPPAGAAGWRKRPSGGSGRLGWTRCNGLPHHRDPFDRI